MDTSGDPIAARRKNRKRRYWLPLAVAAAAVTVGFGFAVQGSPSAGVGNPNQLFLHMRGQRTADGSLVVDETRGRFGGLDLGESLAAAKRTMPASYYWSAQVPGRDATYCGYIVSRDVCEGVVVQLTTVCAGWPVCGDPLAVGPVGEITLASSKNPRVDPEAREAVTLRGIRLGTSSMRIPHLYRVTETGSEVCTGQAPPPARAFVSVPGKNTIVFSTHLGVVWAITIFRGRHPHLCSQGGVP